MGDQGTDERQVPTSARPRLVLADDDPVVRSMLSEQLRYRFDCVGAGSNADEAIALVEAHRPDVAILDVNMPGGGARLATREIRARSPHTAIVILSSDETADDVVDLMSMGAITYLRKGIDTNTLEEKLAASIETHRKLGSGEPRDRGV
jgi:DNA-binding NarL/FixJ family response regulator